MNRWVVTAVCAVLLSGIGSAFSLARAAQSTSDALVACAKETDDARRLRCFDAVVADLRRAPPVPAAAVAAKPSAPQPAAPPPTPAPSVSREEKFGARGDLDRERREELKEISAKVTEVGARPHGEIVVTLDNGQVWAERSASSKIKVKVGDTVRIESGALGSFVLIAPNGRSSKVARVR
jgi:biotin carboxyl carrier protein